MKCACRASNPIAVGSSALEPRILTSNYFPAGQGEPGRYAGCGVVCAGRRHSSHRSAARSTNRWPKHAKNGQPVIGTPPSPKTCTWVSVWVISTPSSCRSCTLDCAAHSRMNAENINTSGLGTDVRSRRICWAFLHDVAHVGHDEREPAICECNDCGTAALVGAYSTRE